MPVNYKKKIWILFFVSIALGACSFFTMLHWGLEFAGVPMGIGIIAYPILTVQFILCLLGEENKFPKVAYALSVAATTAIGLTTLAGLCMSLT